MMMMIVCGAGGVREIICPSKGSFAVLVPYNQIPGTNCAAPSDVYLSTALARHNTGRAECNGNNTVRHVGGLASAATDA